jgi:hypothetical protein
MDAKQDAVAATADSVPAGTAATTTDKAANAVAETPVEEQEHTSTTASIEAGPPTSGSLVPPKFEATDAKPQTKLPVSAADRKKRR